MDLFGNLALASRRRSRPENLFFCFVGVLLGTLVGVLPGIGPTATIAMLLPVTFNFEPVTALIMLAGIYYGAQYGGSTTAILINLPGESSSAVTAIDGHEMARGGRAGPRSLRPRSARSSAGSSAPSSWCCSRPRSRASRSASGPPSSSRSWSWADRVDRAGARVDAERPGDDRAGTPVRHGRTGHLHGHAALHLRCPGVVLGDQLRVGRGRHVRHRRDPAQPRGRCDPLRRDQDRQEPVADAGGRSAASSAPVLRGTALGVDAGRPAGRRSRPGVVRARTPSRSGSPSVRRHSDTARSRASPAPNRPTMPRLRPRSSRCSRWASRRTP